ncbi:MAG: transposase [Rhodocyclaceae bacterium]
MRSQDVTQSLIFSCRTLEERIPESHPLRKLRARVDEILLSMSDAFAAAYPRTGRASIARERLLRASLRQVFFPLRAERQLVQHLEFNRLYRWFVGLNKNEAVWDHSSFTTTPLIEAWASMKRSNDTHPGCPHHTPCRLRSQHLQTQAH